jgi:hypothetical protein
MQYAVQIETVFPFFQEIVGAERVFECVRDHEPARAESRRDKKSKNVQGKDKDGDQEDRTLDRTAHIVGVQLFLLPDVMPGRIIF